MYNIGNFPPPPPSLLQRPPVPPAYYTEPPLPNATSTANQTPKQPTNVENWIGRNVLGIIAAVLVFLGVISLGFLVIPNLNDVIKVVLMFALSISLVIAGSVLTHHKKNVFTSALLGCGCGSLFISILVTHAFFHLINDVVAFSLLLVWLAGSLFLVKLSDSFLMSLIAHLGMVVSLCFAYSAGVTQDRILLLVIYQTLSIALITIGNKICYQKTYRLGLFTSLTLSLIAVLAMTVFYADTLHSFESVNLLVACLAMLAQLLCVALLSYWIYVASLSLESTTARIVSHIFNKSIVICVLFCATFLFPQELFRTLLSPDSAVTTISHLPLLIAVAISSIFAAIHIAISIMLGKRNEENRALEIISVLSLCAYCAQIMAYNYCVDLFFYPAALRLSGLLFIGIGLIACAHFTKRVQYSYVGWCVLAADLIIMLLGGYASLAHSLTIFSAVFYLLIFVAIAVFEWKSFSEAAKSNYRTGFKISILLLVELSIFSIFFTMKLDVVYALLIVAALFVAVLATGLDKGKYDNRSFTLFIRIHALVITFINICAIDVASATGIEQALYWMLAVLNGALLALSLAKMKNEPMSFHWIGVIIGVLFSLLTLTSLSQLTHWINEPYSLSICLMVTSFICIGAGFITRIKPLRLYGLIAIIVCVLKLVTVDIGLNTDMLMRVIALIVGGLICFGISALYTYTVKRFEGENEVK